MPSDATSGQLHPGAVVCPLCAPTYDTSTKDASHATAWTLPDECHHGRIHDHLRATPSNGQATRPGVVIMGFTEERVAIVGCVLRFSSVKPRAFIMIVR